MSIWMPNGEKVEAAELEKKKEESREEKEQREGNEV